MDDSDLDERDDSKRKNRNSSEKKRRDVFNNLINELSSMVTRSSRKMDKGSVLQATIAYLKNYKDTPPNDVAEQSLDRSWFPDSLTQSEFNRIMLEGQDAFTICISFKGHILYVSDAIASILGYVPQYLRSAIFNIVHEDDHAKAHSLLKTASSSDLVAPKDLSLLFTTTLHLRWGPLRDTPTGRTEVYEPFKFVGYFKNYARGRLGSMSSKEPWHPCYVAIALPLRIQQISRELMIPDGTTLEFMSRYSLEWKFLLLDNRAADIIGYLPFEIIGTSGYDYYHIDDLPKIVQGHRTLLQTGEGTSCHYRFRTKGSQWVWLQTRYYISYQQWNSKPEYIVCTHRVLRYVRERGALVSNRPLSC
ncbi:circadian locomoter output cycles protein kaput-like [Galendromus occidentalis]|uniref:Circadian locomoter output cycles protein kaput-like n=1 Tax=Galendromus occidentalis TaxID=34638 RepID=A0AAJ7SEY7_9ACAR|nr:circadian locomoter output cycles protein kaput-like [Galendromus occidentalis]